MAVVAAESWGWIFLCLDAEDEFEVKLHVLTSQTR